MSGEGCIGCSDPPGPFFCIVGNVQVQLCASCAARLLAGESKGDVIKSTNISNKKAV